MLAGKRGQCRTRRPRNRARPRRPHRTAGSDGLFDNLYLHDAARLVSAHFQAAGAPAPAAGDAGASPFAAPRLQHGKGGAAEPGQAPSTAAAAAAEALPAAELLGACEHEASSCGSTVSLARASSSSSLDSAGGACGGAARRAWPDAQVLAEALAGAARANSVDPQYVSAFGLVDRAIKWVARGFELPSNGAPAVRADSALLAGNGGGSEHAQQDARARAPATRQAV